MKKLFVLLLLSLFTIISFGKKPVDDCGEYYKYTGNPHNKYLVYSDTTCTDVELCGNLTVLNFNPASNLTQDRNGLQYAKRLLNAYPVKRFRGKEGSDDYTIVKTFHIENAQNNRLYVDAFLEYKRFCNTEANNVIYERAILWDLEGCKIAEVKAYLQCYNCYLPLEIGKSYNVSFEFNTWDWCGDVLNMYPYGFFQL